MSAWIDRLVDRLMHEGIERCMDGWSDRWMTGQMNGWIDAKMCVFIIESCAA